MLFLICKGQKRWSSQAEAQPCCSGSYISLTMPFLEPWDIPMSWIQDVGTGKNVRDKKKSSFWQRLLQTKGTFRNTMDLISVYTTVNEPCTALVSKHFSSAHSFLQMYSRVEAIWWNWCFSHEKDHTTSTCLLQLLSGQGEEISLEKQPDSHITARCSMFCFLLCLQEIWEDTNKNISTSKLTDRRSRVWSHCFFFQIFFRPKDALP